MQDRGSCLVPTSLPPEFIHVHPSTLSSPICTSGGHILLVTAQRCSVSLPKPIPTKTHPPGATWTQTHLPRSHPTTSLPSISQKIPRDHFSQRRPEAQDLHQGEITAIINIFKAVPFPAPQGQKEPSTAGQKSLAVGQAGMEGMEGHRVPERCGRHSSEGMTTLLTLTALPGQG